MGYPIASAAQKCGKSSSALRRLGVDIDIIGPDDDVSGYRLIVVPCLPILDAARLARFQASGARILFGPRTGSKTASFAIPDTLAPGPLGAAIGFSIPRVESLRTGIGITVDGAGIGGAITIWREQIHDDGAAIVARCADGAPALLERGNFAYLAGWPDAGLLDTVLSRLARLADLQVTRVSDGLRIRRRGACHFAFNSGPDTATVPIPPNARLLFGSAELPVAGVAVWTEKS